MNDIHTPSIFISLFLFVSRWTWRSECCKMCIAKIASILLIPRLHDNSRCSGAYKSFFSSPFCLQWAFLFLLIHRNLDRGRDKRWMGTRHTSYMAKCCHEWQHNYRSNDTPVYWGIFRSLYLALALSFSLLLYLAKYIYIYILIER